MNLKSPLFKSKNWNLSLFNRFFNYSTLLARSSNSSGPILSSKRALINHFHYFPFNIFIFSALFDVDSHFIRHKSFSSKSPKRPRATKPFVGRSPKTPNFNRYICVRFFVFFHHTSSFSISSGFSLHGRKKESLRRCSLESRMRTSIFYGVLHARDGVCVRGVAKRFCSFCFWCCTLHTFGLFVSSPGLFARFTMFRSSSYEE